MALIDRAITVKTAAKAGDVLPDILDEQADYAWEYFSRHGNDVIYTIYVKRWFFRLNVEVKVKYLYMLFMILFGPKTFNRGGKDAA